MALPGIRKALRRFRVPFIASVSLDGVVNVRWVEGEHLARSVRIAPPRSKK